MSDRGKCPSCSSTIGAVAILKSWDNWGKFKCPACGSHIAFKMWLLVVLVLMALFVILERIFHVMLISDLPTCIPFTFSTIVGLLIIFIVPMMWGYREIDEHRTERRNYE